MYSPLRTSLIALLLTFFFFQLVHSGSTQAQSAPQTQSGQQGTNPEKAPPPKEKQPEYSQESLVIEQVKTLYRFEKNGTGQHELTPSRESAERSCIGKVWPARPPVHLCQ
jgi:hypothetical protein